MNTPHKEDLKRRHEKDNKNYEIWVENTETKGDLTFIVQTQFKSIEEVLHKIELDLMTNLHYGFSSPITIKIFEIK
jgi:hypothetical protein